MQQVLLVEDSIMFGRLAKSKIEKAFDVSVIWAKTLADTEKVLEMSKERFTEHMKGRPVSMYVD